MLIKVQNQIVELRQQAKPENILKAEVLGKLSQVKYQAPDKDHKEETDSCAICTDEFKSKQVVTKTPCNHLFHDKCLWQWIDTKLKQTMVEALQQIEAPDIDEMDLHPAANCIECPLCNQPMVKSTLEERKTKQKKILALANEKQANYMGISREALENIQKREGELN